MDQRLYRTGQFARKAAVSIRTLRYYDREGLLAPSGYSAAGYRLYTDADLGNLQQILALKFLGFSLEEIKALLRAGPHSLADVLAQQKAMMRAKRAQLDGIIQAIEQTEHLLQTGACDWDSLAGVIQAIQMDQNKEWVNKYLTPEQQQQMQRLSEQSYSDAAREKLAARVDLCADRANGQLRVLGTWFEGPRTRPVADALSKELEILGDWLGLKVVPG